MKKGLRWPSSEPVWETPNKNCIFPVFFGDRFEGKEDGLRTHKPSSQDLGDKIDFSIKRLMTLNL
jgi:hypothetical protein